MMRGLVTISICLTCVLMTGAATAGGPFSGTFVGPEGDSLVLEQKGGRVTGQIQSEGVSGQVKGKVQGQRLRGQLVMPWGDSMGFSATKKGAGLVITLDGDPEATFFTRQGGQPVHAVPEPEPDPPAGQDSPAAVVAPPKAPKAVRLAAKGAASQGKVHRAQYDGWSVRAPKGWKMAERNGALVLGSDREAGLIIVRAVAVRDPQQLRQGLASELAASGAAFGPAPELSEVRLAGGRAVYAEMSGSAQDGSRIQLRAIGVIGPAGTVGVYGLTTPGDKFDRLRKRIDAMARSVRFFKPKVSPGRAAVVGEWFSFSSAGPSGVGGSESHLAFCRDGRFFRRGEASYSGNAGTSEAWGVAGQSGSAGRWSARGNQRQGTIVITQSNGGTYEISYQVQKPRDGINFNGRLHGLKGKSDLCR